MADLENTVNTAGEAGQNTNLDFENFVRSIIGEKVEKAYKSTYQVAKSNQEKFGMSDSDVELAVNNLKADREKEAKKEAEKYSNALKELEAAKAKIAEYETEKRNTLIKQNSIDVLNSLEIKEQKDISLIQDLAGDKLYACVKEDGSFDSEKAKTLFEDITKIYGLSFEKKKEHENPYFRLGGNPQGNSSVKKTKSFHQALEENLKF